MTSIVSESHGGIYAAREATLLNFKVSHVENFKACGASVINGLVNGDSYVPDC